MPNENVLKRLYILTIIHIFVFNFKFCVIRKLLRLCCIINSISLLFYTDPRFYFHYLWGKIFVQLLYEFFNVYGNILQHKRNNDLQPIQVSQAQANLTCSRCQTVEKRVVL